MCTVDARVAQYSVGGLELRVGLSHMCTLYLSSWGRVEIITQPPQAISFYLFSGLLITRRFGAEYNA